VCVGGGVGTAVLLPIVAPCPRRRARHQRHRRPLEGWVILEPELRACGDVVVCTDDGSYGRHGFVTQALKDLLDAGGVDAVAIGPVPMMKAVSGHDSHGVETTVSLPARSWSTGPACAAAAA
jgi:ferredoxin--NADP+ reductase